MSERSLVNIMGKVTSKLCWTAMATASRADARNIEILQSRNEAQSPSNVEWVKKYTGAAFIEPTFGYIISRDGYLIEESLQRNSSSLDLPWRRGMPAVSDYRKGLSSSAKVIKLQSAVSLRHTWEWNYYHFYIDVLGKLSLLDEAGIDPATPLVIGRYYDDAPYVREIIGRGLFGKREWIVQRDESVLANEVYYCVTKQTRFQRLDYIAEQMNVAKPDPTTGRRIYLKRPQNGSRHVINNDEVEEIVAKYGFESFDFVGSSVADQSEILNSTRHLIAVHGAGMVNIMFRRGAPLNIIELQSPIFSSEDFLIIAREAGYSWTNLIGHSAEGPPQQSSFRVDITALEAKINESLASE